MARPLAQLEQDVADAERLATLSVAQTVARRLLEEVRERDALLREVGPRVRRIIDNEGYSVDDLTWLGRIEAAVREL